jgi:hypothetical protein
MSRTYIQWSADSAELIWKDENDLGEISSGSIERNSDEIQSFLGNGGEIITRELAPRLEEDE